MQRVVPQMREAGWEVIIPQGFRHHVLEVDAWEGEFDEEEDGWFSLNMGIVVNGQRLPLAPMLHELFKIDPRWLEASLLEKCTIRRRSNAASGWGQGEGHRR
jgi:hypothetical protein